MFVSRSLVEASPPQFFVTESPLPVLSLSASSRDMSFSCVRVHSRILAPGFGFGARFRFRGLEGHDHCHLLQQNREFIPALILVPVAVGSLVGAGGAALKGCDTKTVAVAAVGGGVAGGLCVATGGAAAALGGAEVASIAVTAATQAGAGEVLAGSVVGSICSASASAVAKKKKEEH